MLPASRGPRGGHVHRDRAGAETEPPLCKTGVEGGRVSNRVNVPHATQRHDDKRYDRKRRCMYLSQKNFSK